MDYTSNGPALHTLVKENKLKESGTIDDSKYAVKDAPKHSHFQEEKPKPKPKEEPVKVEPPQYVNTKSEYQSDYSSKSQFNDKPVGANNDLLNSLLGKSQKQDTFSVKSQEQAPYGNSQGWQSPVDLGYGSKVTNMYSQSNNFSINPSGMVSPMQNNFAPQPIQPMMPNSQVQAGGFAQSNNFNNFNAVGSYSNSNVVNYGNSGVSKPGSSFYENGFDSKVEAKKPSSYNPPVQPY